jgi:UDP-N-acetylmuramate dehydrogenase
MQIEENKSLAPLTTFRIGGAARWYVEALSEDDVVEATRWAEKQRAPLLVLGGGSNLLVSDSGFNGLVLRIGLKGIRVFVNENPKRELDDPRGYDVAAGEDWDQFVQRAVDDECAGIECLAGIPGTVGGTPVQNVGAYGQEVSTTIASVRALDLHEGVFRFFSNSDCEFAYRKSRFNAEERGRYIVTRVVFALRPGGAPEIKYNELKWALDAVTPTGVQPTLAEVAAAVRRLRQNKGMLLVEGDPNCRSAGSFFKNPVVTASQAMDIAAICDKEPPRYPAGAGGPSADLVKIPAAWLIEQAGFTKGYRLGAAGISSRHTLALVNLGGATAQEILSLASQITDAVEGRFGIRLEREPVLVGFD